MDFRENEEVIADMVMKSFKSVVVVHCVSGQTRSAVPESAS